MKVLVLFIFSCAGITLTAQSGGIYISDAGNFNNPPWQILRVDDDGQNPTVFIDEFLNWPQDILFLEDRNQVLISNLGSGCINIHDALTGDFIQSFACGISGPTRTKIGPDSLLYVLQWSGTGKVKRYDLNGNFVDDFTQTGVNQSIGLDWDTHGNLYVSSYNGDKVEQFDTAGVSQGNFVSSNLQGPTNIWFDTNGDLLVVDYDGTAVKRFDSTGAFVGNFITGIFHAEGVDSLPNGNILLGNGSTNAVKMYQSDGTFISDIVPSGTANLITPNAVVFRDETNISWPEPEVKFGFAVVVPQPERNQIRLLGDIQQKADSLSIHDMNGQVILKMAYPESTNIVTFNSDSNGIYFMTFELSNGNTTTESFTWVVE